jgi:nucleoside-diphosphate-sugar epimerase
MSSRSDAQPKTVLVTGGAGFIGSNLVRRLLRHGYKIRVFDNFTTGKSANLVGLDSVEIVEGDVRSQADVARATLGIHAIFHLAAIASVERSWSDPVATLAVNAHGTANVVEAAVESEVSALVYSSSASVYGDYHRGLTSENVAPRPISPYGYSKLLGEKIVLAHSRPFHGIRIVALRYFNVYGPRQDPESPYSGVIPIFMKHALTGTTATIYGDGKQSRDFLHVEDVADANISALTGDASGLAINIASGRSHTLLQLVHAIEEATRRPLRTTSAPPREGDIRHSLADITLSATTIGFRPKVSFAKGLRNTLKESRLSGGRGRL